MRDQSRASSGTKSPVLVIPEGSPCKFSSDGSVGEATPVRQSSKRANKTDLKSETKKEQRRP